MTVAQNTDLTQVVGNFKQTYAKDFTDNRPMFAVLQEELPPNRDGIEVGVTINVPVLLTHHGGETYGTSGDTSNLRAPVAIEIKDASSDQYEITVPVRFPFGLLSKAAQSKAARFADKARLLALSGDTAAKRAAELALLHGSNSLGKVLSVGSVTGPSGGVYSLDVTFTVQSWSDGIWGAVENLPFDFYSALTAGTKRNTNDVTMSLVKGWSADATSANRRTVTFTAPLSTDLSTIQANDFVFSASAYAKQLPGLMYQAGLASGVTHLGISTNYSMWRPKQTSISGPITFGKLLSGISPAVSHGADGKLTVITGALNWADMMKDLASTRRADWSYKSSELKNGAKKVAFSYSNGDLDIVLHPFMKDGDVVAFSPDQWFRAGSDPDPVMTLGEKQLSVMSSTANVVETRFWSAQTLVPNCLATTIYLSGITPNLS